ncbi:MAG: 5'-methylthioadenosine/adenosylhomocysteine nucleosidase [Pontiellaceae bacterium]
MTRKNLTINHETHTHTKRHTRRNPRLPDPFYQYSKPNQRPLHHTPHPIRLHSPHSQHHRRWKVSAAMTTQYLIDRFQPSTILFTGLAGALNPTYEIGDIILADRCIQYDIDASELGFPAGTIPYTEYHTFTPDAALLKLAQQIKTDQTLNTGTILTGDQFMTHDKRAHFQNLFDHFQGDAIEMEGAALAHVCTHNQTPFLLIRTISDKANADAPTDFTAFLQTASQTSFQLIQNLLNMIYAEV